MSVKSSRSDGRWDHMRESLRSCPSWGPLFHTPANTSPALCPEVWDSQVGLEELLVSLPSLQVTAQLLQPGMWEKVWLQLGRAPWNSSLSHLAPGAKLLSIPCVCPWQVLGEATCSRIWVRESCAHTKMPLLGHRVQNLISVCGH